MKKFRKHIIHLIFLSLLATSLAQSPNYCNDSDCRFYVPQNDAIDSSVITYAQNVWSIDEWDNNAGCVIPIVNVHQCENLNMLVFSPHLQPGEKRPLVVLIHGGGFITGSYADFTSTARSLAQMGYVAATIDYRLCKRNNCLVIAATGCLNLCNSNFMADFGTGSYVATVDANNAIRYLQQNAAQFHIDPNNVIVGGHSAGAWTAMNVAFLSQQEADAISPSFQPYWGNLNPVSGIKGVICMSGAVLDTNIIDANEHIPVFVLHGTCDPTVCYDYDAAFHCNNAYPSVFGGRRIAERMKNLGLPFYLFTGIGMGHDIGPLSNIWLPEALRYMRSAMLCSDFIQKHVAYALDPASAECQLLQFDGAGCDLQYNHAQLPQSNLPVSAIWGGPPPPCGNGLTNALEPESQKLFSAYPTLFSDVLNLEIKNGAGSASAVLTNALGEVILKENINGGESKQLIMSNLTPGVYFLQYQLQQGGTAAIKLVKQ